MNGLNGNNSGNTISGQIGNVLRLFSSEIQREVSGSQDERYGSRNGTPTANITFLMTAEEVEEVREARRRARPSIINSVSNLQSTSPSPDEMIIKERGRRSLPVKWSPIPFESPQKTPLRSLVSRSPKKGLITLRSSPRKRLQMNEASGSDIVQHRKALLSTSPLARRSVGPEPGYNSKSSGKEVGELSKDQLLLVLNSIFEKHPQIKEEVGTILDKRVEDSDGEDGK